MLSERLDDDDEDENSHYIKNLAKTRRRLSATVIIVRNEIADKSSNSGRGCLRFISIF